MAGKEMEFAIKVGGYLSQKLTTAVGNTTKLLRSLGDTGEQVTEKLKSIQVIDAKQKKLETQTGRLREAYGKLSNATKERMAYTGQDAEVQARLTRKQQEAEAKVAQLLKKTKDLSKQNIAYKNSIEKLYGPINKLIKDEDRLSKAAEKSAAARAYQEKIERGRKNRTNLLMGADYRLSSARNITGMLRTPFENAVASQKMSFELSTVINTDEKNKKAAMAQAQKSAEDLAKAGYSTYAEAMQAQYALNSAELAAGLSSVAVKTVASVAKVTKGELGQVGEVLATAYNNLGNRVSGTTEEKFAALGNILTKVQFKYQIRDFAQLGESMKYAAVGITQYNVNLEQSAAAIGMLNTAGLQGGQAGTSFNSMLKGLYKVAADIPGILVKDKNGAVDLVASLGELQKGLSRMDDITRAQFLTEMFGDEGAKAIIPLVSKTDELAAGYKEVGAAVKENIVDKNMAEYLKLTSTRMAAAKEQAMLLGMKIGNVLLPPVTKMLEYGGKLADKIGEWAEAHPFITKLVVGVVAAGVALNLAGAAIMYVGAGFSSFFTLLQNGNLFIKTFRVAMSGGSLEGLKFAKVAGLLSKGIFGLGKAFTLIFSPGGLILLGIAAVVAAVWYLYKNWETVKTGLMAWWKTLGEMWDSFCAKFPTASNVIKGAVDLIVGYYKGLWSALKKVWEWGTKALGVLGFGGETPKVSGNAVTGKVKASETSRKMPKMARGGYISRPTVALVGEAGDEIIVPVTDRRYGIQRLAEAAAHLGFNIAPVQNRAIEGHGAPAMRALREKAPIAKIATATKQIFAGYRGSSNNEAINKSNFNEQIYNFAYSKIMQSSTVSKEKSILEKLQNRRVGTEAIGDKTKTAPTITYAPNFTIYGNPDRESLVDLLREDKKRFKRLLEEVLHDKERVNFA